jgi:hypothetical protein
MTASRTTMMTVAAGQTTLGVILRRGETFEAFDRAEKSLGVFDTERAAADAITDAIAAGACTR